MLLLTLLSLRVCQFSGSVTSVRAGPAGVWLYGALFCFVCWSQASLNSLSDWRGLSYIQTKQKPLHSNFLTVQLTDLFVSRLPTLQTLLVYALRFLSLLITSSAIFTPSLSHPIPPSLPPSLFLSALRLKSRKKNMNMEMSQRGFHTSGDRLRPLLVHTHTHTHTHTHSSGCSFIHCLIFACLYPNIVFFVSRLFHNSRPPLLLNSDSLPPRLRIVSLLRSFSDAGVMSWEGVGAGKHPSLTGTQATIYSAFLGASQCGRLITKSCNC